MKRHAPTAALLLALLLPTASQAFNVSDAEESHAHKRYGEAFALAQWLTRAEPDNHRALAIRAWSEFALGRYAEALAHFATLREQAPTNFHGYFGKAWVLMQQGDLDGAQAWLDRADRWCAPHQLTSQKAARGWLALHRGDLDEAQRQFHGAEGEVYHEDYVYYHIDETVRHNWAAMPLIGFGWVALERGELEAARRHFLLALKRDAECHYCYDGLAEIASREGDEARAFRLAFTGLVKGGYDAALVTRINRHLAADPSPDTALDAYRHLVRLAPRNPHYRANLAYVQLSRGEVGEALKGFRTALELQPDHELALSGLAALEERLGLTLMEGWAAYARGDYAAAADHFRAEAEGNPQALNGLGWSLLGLGRPGEAHTAFNTLVKGYPDYLRGAGGLAMAEMRVLPGYLEAMAAVADGDAARGAELLKPLRNAAGAPWLLDNADGWLAYGRGDMTTARTAFEAALKAAPHAYPGRRGLGLTLLRLGDHAAGVRLLLESQWNAPLEGEAAIAEAAPLLIDGGHATEAVQLLRVALQGNPGAKRLPALLADAHRALDDRVGADYWAGRSVAGEKVAGR